VLAKYASRLECEMKEFEQEAKNGTSSITFNNSEIVPRSTGSLEWRLQRGEMGGASGAG